VRGLDTTGTCTGEMSLTLVAVCAQREALAGGVDMVICTPGRFSEHLAAGNLNLDAAKAVVLDEVDVLMGEGCGGVGMRAQAGVLLGKCHRLGL